MAKDLWLPKGHVLQDGSKIRSLLYFGAEWQIFDTNVSSNILLTRPDLAHRWSDKGFLDCSLFEEVAFGAESFRALISPKKYILAPVENGQSSKSKVDALAFALVATQAQGAFR